MNPFEFTCDRSLRGLPVVNISVFATFPYSAYFDKDKEFRGSDIEAMDTLASYFDYKTNMMSMRTWVQDPETGKWTGIVGEVG